FHEVADRPGPLDGESARLHKLVRRRRKGRVGRSRFVFGPQGAVGGRDRGLRQQRVLAYPTGQYGADQREDARRRGAWVCGSSESAAGKVESKPRRFLFSLFYFSKLTSEPLRISECFWKSSSSR